MSKLKEIVGSPWLNFISGIILLITSGNEILKDIKGDIGAHHGVAFFGLVQIVQFLPHIMDATEQVSKIDKD